MVVSPDDNDHRLIAAAQRGDRHALDELVRLHAGWVRNVVYATIGNAGAVDDIVQHVWTNVWQQIGSLAELSRWRGWLYRMAKNAAIDAGIKNARQRKLRLALAETEYTAPASSDPVRMAIEKEETARVLDAIKGLPEIYREPFMLRHLENWSYAQIAEAMSLPVDTVETRLVRARRLLRTALRGLTEDQEVPSQSA